MKKKFPFAELRSIAMRLPAPVQSEFEDGNAESFGRRCLRAYEGIIKTGLDLSSVPKPLHGLYREAVAVAVHNLLKHTTAAEATLAGVALPQFVRQKIAMIMRAYPKLVAPQLVGFFPMRGPTGLVGYTVAEYENAYTASTPNVNPGDRIDDPTKTNRGYSTVAEGGQARRVKRRVARQTITAITHRVITEWSKDLVEDAAADWDLDMPSLLINDCGDHMAMALDVDVIDALDAGAPAAHDTSFDVRPATYYSLSPSEQRAYDELMIKRGVVPTIRKINRTNQWDTDYSPNWGLCSPNAVGCLEGVRGFTAVQTGPDSFDLETGAIRFVGTMNSVAGGVRIFASKHYKRTETTSGSIMFGRKPQSIMDRGIRVGMYVPLEVTQELYDPNTDLTVKGLRSRYAILTKDAGVPDSDMLVDIYGELTLTNASSVE